MLYVPYISCVCKSNVCYNGLLLCLNIEGYLNKYGYNQLKFKRTPSAGRILPSHQVRYMSQSPVHQSLLTTGFTPTPQVYANQDLEVTDKYSGKVAYKVARAGAADIDEAIAAAVAAAAPMAALASYQRREILEYCVTQFKARTGFAVQVRAYEVGHRGGLSRKEGYYRI